MNSWQPGQTLEIIEKEAIQKAYKFYNGNKTQTAASLGIAIRTLDSKLEKYEAERIDQEQRTKNAERKEREYQERARGNVKAINDAANSSIRIPEEKKNGSVEDGDGSEARVRVQSTQKLASQHEMSMSKREEVQELSSRSSATSNPRKAR